MTEKWKKMKKAGQDAAFSASVGFICKNEKGTSDFSKVPVLLGWEMGFEPTVFGTTIRRFNQLSYTHHRCILKKEPLH